MFNLLFLFCFYCAFPSFLPNPYTAVSATVIKSEMFRHNTGNIANACVTQEENPISPTNVLTWMYLKQSQAYYGAYGFYCESL